MALVLRVDWKRRRNGTAHGGILFLFFFSQTDWVKEILNRYVMSREDMCVLITYVICAIDIKFKLNFKMY